MMHNQNTITTIRSLRIFIYVFLINSDKKKIFPKSRESTGGPIKGTILSFTLATNRLKDLHRK